VADWGRSEVDGMVTRRGYVGLDVRDVVIRPEPVTVWGRPPRDGRQPIVVEGIDPADLPAVRVADSH
jgi:hypothetical protein